MTTHATRDSQTESMALGLWFRPMGEAMESYGVDSAAVFAKAGVDLESLTDAWQLYPVSIRNRVWELAIEATGDPCFGLRTAEFMRPPMLGYLGYSLLASSTLFAMFRRLERFFLVVSTDGSHKIEKLPDAYRILITINEPTLRVEAIDAWMLILVRLCQSMYSTDFNPLKIEFRRPAPCDGARNMQDWFNCPVSFSANRIALYISAHDMHAKLPGAVRTLAIEHDKVLASFLAKHRKSDILTRVRVLITELLPSGECSKTEIAKRCNMSPRTLQNKLSQVGTSYHSLLDSVREELALEYIKQPYRSLLEITFLLGFTDSSSFSRAFKRWTGSPPSQYEI